MMMTADECEDDDDDGGHGGPDGHGEHLPVNLTLVAVEVSLALAHARPGRVHAAAALVVAELRWTGLAVAPRQTRLARVLVPVTLETLASKAPEEVDTDAVVTTVVVLGLAT